jgi:hypothetical protein
VAGITVERIRDVMRWTRDSVSLETVMATAKDGGCDDDGSQLTLNDAVDADTGAAAGGGSAERVEGDVERDLLRTELENLLDTQLPVRLNHPVDPARLQCELKSRTQFACELG